MSSADQRGLRGRGTQRTVLGYVPDLMDRSKLAAAADDIRFVGDPAELVATEADLVVVDLGRPGVIEVLPLIDVRVIGFARHTSTDVLAAAREAGCDEVLVRSSFFGGLPDVLR